MTRISATTSVSCAAFAMQNESIGPAANHGHLRSKHGQIKIDQSKCDRGSTANFPHDKIFSSAMSHDTLEVR